jgi:hypothetical protein
MRAMAAPSTGRAARAAARPLRLPAPAAPLLVFAATLALYLSTLTGVHTFDALSYILDVQHKPLAELYHPHHLAYGPLGWLAYHSARLLGYSGTASLPLQLVNALAGALGVTLFFRILRQITGLAEVALAGAALLALSYAFWYYAVEVEVYTLAALFLIACLGQIARLLEHPTRRGYALLGMLQGLAVLFHQTNLLLCVPVVAMWLWLSRTAGARSLGPVFPYMIAYGLVLALTVGLPYGFVALSSGLTSPDALRGWLLSYAETGWWGGPITANKWALLGAGLSQTLAARGGAFLGLWLLGLLLIHARYRLSAIGYQLSVIALAWLLVYGAFFLWWEPDNVEFWIASLPPALLLLVLALAHGEQHWRRRPGLTMALAIALTLGTLNGEAIIQRGDPRQDLQRLIVEAYVAASGPDDLLLVPDGLQELYLPFYAGRLAPYSWNQAFHEHGPDWQAVCAAVQARVEAALHAGAGVLLADEVLNPPALLSRRHGVTAERAQACLGAYLADTRPLPLPGDQPPALRLPDANQRARGEGWQFARHAWGWRATNVADARFEGAWVFRPASDPFLLSPALAREAADVGAVEIVLDTGGLPGEGQFFWAGTDGLTDESRSLRFALRPTAGPHTYRLDLASAPTWQGAVTRLRLDPLGSGDGRLVRVLSLRLLPR